jgi:hypothetical protein
MANQVPVVAILMIVNGVIVSLMGLFFAIAGPATLALQFLAPGPGQRAPNSVDTVFMTVLSGFYVVMGLLVLVSGILNIVAGIRCLSYRGRTLALVALFSNLVPMLTCYCIPTSLGLMIYGLIVMFQSDVAYAFAEVARGVPPERFKRGRRYREEELDEEEEEELRPEDADVPSLALRACRLSGSRFPAAADRAGRARRSCDTSRPRAARP